MNRQILVGVAGCVLFATVGFLGFKSLTAQAQEAAGGPVDILVSAEALSLQPLQGENVRFAGGWSLRSANEDFGGFSGLVLDPNANTLIAINDKGDWWQAGFNPLAGTAPTSGTLRGYVPGTVADKIDLDSESLARFRGGFLVSFEQRHRIEFVANPGSKPAPSGLAPINFAGVSGNSGLEAIAMLPSGALLAFAERGLDLNGRLKAWLVTEGAATNISFKPPANFAPTDAAALPNGDVLLLLRKYSAVEGVAVKVLHIKAEDIQPGTVLGGVEILHLTPEGAVDNMEGLDVIAMDENTVRMVMISDDNFNPLQRTLLMMFDYDYR